MELWKEDAKGARLHLHQWVMPVSCLGEPSPLAPKEATGGAVLFSVSYVTKAATSVSAAAYWRLICSGTPMGGVQWPEAAPLPPLQRQ